MVARSGARERGVRMVPRFLVQVTGKEGLGKKGGRGWGEHVWGRMGIGKSALDLGVLRRWLVLFRRQLTYKSGACKKKSGVFGI